MGKKDLNRLKIDCLFQVSIPCKREGNKWNRGTCTRLGEHIMCQGSAKIYFHPSPPVACLLFTEIWDSWYLQSTLKIKVFTCMYSCTWWPSAFNIIIYMKRQKLTWFNNMLLTVSSFFLIVSSSSTQRTSTRPSNWCSLSLSMAKVQRQDAHQWTCLLTC